MKTFTKVIFALVFIISPFMNTFAQNVSKFFVDGSLYVKLSDHATLNVANENGKINPQEVYFLNGLVEKYQIKDLQMSFFTANNDKLQRTFKLNFSNKEEINSLIKELESNKDIEYVEKIPTYFTSSFSSDPDDEYYNSELTGSFLSESLGTANSSWHLDLIKTKEAWEALEDASSRDNTIKIAVLDNAVWIDHPDLTNMISGAIDLADGDNDPNPPVNSYKWTHGTHIAGIISAETNNTIGIASIGNDLQIIAVKLSVDSGDGGRLITNGAEGIIWAADNGANVINISWESPEWSMTMLNAVNYAYNKGVVIVASAGNNGNENKTYPAAYENVIAVASCDIGNNKSDFSNYGSWIDVMAPGGYATSGNSQGLGRFSILSTTCNIAGTVSDIVLGESGGAASYSVAGNYDLMQGTSSATALTSGLCALMLSANPTLTPSKIKETLLSTCDNVDGQNTTYVGKIGAGRINALEAVNAAMEIDSDLVADFTASAISIELGDALNFTNESTGTYESLLWEFEGATPRTSTEENPQNITYNRRGLFSVKLTLISGTSSISETKNAMIAVGTQVENPETQAKSNWVEQNLHLNDGLAILDIEIVNDSSAWALVFDSATGDATTDLVKTTNSGNTWTHSIINIASNYLPVDLCALSNDTALLLVSDISGGGTIFKTVDGGTTWVNQASANFGGDVIAIKMYNNESGIAIGNPVNNRFEIYHTEDGGGNWTLVENDDLPEAVPGEEAVARVFAVATNSAWFGTTNGYLYRSSNRGHRWTKVLVEEDHSVKALAFYNTTLGMVYYEKLNGNEVESSFFARTSDAGNTWTNIDIEERRITGISIVPGKINSYVVITNDIVGVENSASLYTTDNGANWLTIDTSINYSTVTMFNENRGWAGGYVGDMSEGIYMWPEAPYLDTYPEKNILEEQAYSYLAVAHDVNDREISFRVVRKPAWLSNFVDNGDGTATFSGISYPINTDTLSRYPLVFTISNGIVSREFRDTIYVRTRKTAPVITSTPVLTGREYRLYEYLIETTNAEEDESILITAPTIPGWLGIEDKGDGTAILAGVPISRGQYGVVISVTDRMFTVTQNFTITVDELSVQDFGYGEISVYPNPSSDILNISNCQGSKYEILDITGRILSEGKLLNSSERIDISEFSNGNLFLKVYNKDNIYTTKIVKM